MADSAPTLLFLCTGNAARSVMAATMMSDRSDQVRVTSAGTHSIEGLPMSSRTRDALAGHGVGDKSHLSSQVDDDMVDEATVIAVFEPMHVNYMRKHHPDAAAKVGSLRRLAQELEPGPLATLAERVRQLDLEHQPFASWEEVIDPAGGDLPVFEASAAEIDELIDVFANKIGAADVGA